MSRRFEILYRVKRRDNLGDPDYWNKRFDDIDRRVDANEQALEDVNEIGDRVEGVALDRINTVVTPLVEEVTTRIRTIPAMFSARSSSLVSIETGRLTFNIDEGERNTFAALAYATVDSIESPGNGIVGKVVSYDAVDGDLVIDALQVIGEGAFDSWSITLSAPPDLVHATRTDNPHQTTAAQVGAYSKAETDAAITEAVGKIDLSSAVNTVVGGAPTSRNTLKKLSDLYDQLSQSLTSATNSFSDLLLKRLRVDAAQGFTTNEQQQGLRNLGVTQLDFQSRLYKAGDLRFVLGTVPPAGWIKANGATLSRASYPDLWAFAQSCGALTDENTWINGGYYGYFTSGDGSSWFRIPDLRGGFIRAYDDGRGVDPGRALGWWQDSQNLSHHHTIGGGSQYVLSLFQGAGGVPWADWGFAGNTIDYSGGSESRPKNVALLACIKI